MKSYLFTRRVVTLGAVVVGGFLLLGCGQTQSGGTAPKTQWGEPDLMGVGQAPKLGASSGKDSFNLTQLEVLYRPEARTKLTQLKDDPALNCVPQGFPRTAVLGWPIQIVQRPGMAIVLSEAFHTFRYIPTDGREHEKDYVFPTFVGTATGKWEGDTLVTDVIAFRENWIAGGQDKPTPASTGVWPTSDALHVTERWRRVDADTLEYQARVEDPAMLTGPWETPKVTFKRQPIDKIEEVKCLGDDPVTPPPAYLAQFGR